VAVTLNKIEFVTSIVLIKLFDNSMNSKCGTHAESYMSLIILYNSIISPRQRLYLSVGKFKNLLLTFSLVQGSGKISSTGYG